MKRFAILSTLSVAGLSLAAVAGTTPDDSTCSATKTAYASKSDKNIVETAAAAGSFKTLAAALDAAGLVGALEGEGPFTVFAPTDDAFAKIPHETLASLLKPENRETLRNILTFHVVAGAVDAAHVVKLQSATALNGQRLTIKTNDAGVNVAGSKVVKTDVNASNGIIHVIDTVMMPSTMDIVDTAVEAGSFNTLAAALKAAGLVDTLKGDGPFTVFAPTDAAFAALPEGTVESLLKPENKEKLVSILTYHVVPGRVYADQLENGKVATVQGSSLKVKLNDKGVFFNDSKVSSADIDTTNGVIHVIDKVLLPK